ncbi:MAG: hypothetical protein J6B39_05660 [Lachnospiraceae bacterium]|nr:hypothetical protein [Lachnospiraceae bacterium]
MEKVLLIVGNGFDLSHGLPTSYSNFKEMLLKIQRKLVLDNVVEQSRIEQLCEQAKPFNASINVSKSELRDMIEKKHVSEQIYSIYSAFLSELDNKLYSRDFYREYGYDISDEDEMDNENIQKNIRLVEKIISEIFRTVNQFEYSKEICVLHNGDFEEMDEIDKIEFILRTFEDIQFLMEKNGKDAWSCFEESCGIIDFNFFMEQVPDDLFLDKEGDLDAWLRDDLLSSMIAPYVSVLESLPIYFANWIDSIDVSKATSNKEFEAFFKAYDVTSMTFNYTDTVENVYNQNSVFHIHGRQGEDIYVGHGNEDVFEDDSNLVLEDAMWRIRNALKKDTKEILKNRGEEFFNSLDKSISKIFVYGFSFGKVDDVYLKRINEMFPEAEWHVQSYLSKDFKDFSKRLLDIGVTDETKIVHWYI